MCCWLPKRCRAALRQATAQIIHVMDATEFAALKKKSKELERVVKRLTLTVEILDADFYQAANYWRENDEGRQFWSRVVIRCLCANVEARLFVFRNAALEMGQVAKISFTKEEIEILTEI